MESLMMPCWISWCLLRGGGIDGVMTVAKDVTLSERLHEVPSERRRSTQLEGAPCGYIGGLCNESVCETFGYLVDYLGI